MIISWLSDLENVTIENEEEHEDEYGARQRSFRFVLVVVLVLVTQSPTVSFKLSIYALGAPNSQ
jgi:hypothetical protein